MELQNTKKIAYINIFVLHKSYTMYSIMYLSTVSVIWP